MNKKNEMNKKGVSAIIATVMILLITVAVSGVVAVTVVPMVREMLDSATICMDATTNIEIDNAGGFTCVDRTSGNINVRIVRKAKDFDLVNVSVLVSAGGTTKTFFVSGSLPGINGADVYTITTTGITPADIETIQIAPIIKNGNSQKTCDVSATVTLKDC